MEWYLNTIYLGEGCYGVQSAAEVYFGKDVSELTPAECASIIAITNNPSLYDPYLYPERNRKRQLTILSEMNAQGYFDSESDYETASAQEMVFHNGRYDEKTFICAVCGFDGKRSDYIKRDDAYYCPNCDSQNYAVDDSNAYSYFVDTVYRDVVNDLCDQYDLSWNAAEKKLLTGGYSIYATIDPTIQATIDHVYENVNNLPGTVSIQQLQSAVVVIDNATGDIVGMSGGVGEKDSSLSLNRATQSKLPVGSSIKPISVYAPALNAGVVTPATVFEDGPLYDNWPQNNDRSYSGHATVYRGVLSSLNTISAKTLDRLGLQNSYDFLTQKLGITTLVENLEIGGQSYSDIAYAPLALGELTYGLTVREVTQAYATFPNDGVFREARSYTKVVDPDGNVVLDNTQESHTAISEKAAFYINYMLRDAVSYGTGGAAYMSDMAVAGKTGTTNNNQCRWFAGYTPYYTCVVWCGYDEPEQIIMSGSYVNPAISMWKQVMNPIHENLEYREFTDYGCSTYKICADCGKLATEACEKDVREDGNNRVVRIRLFSEDVPGKCECHVLVKICEESGKIANEFCESAKGNTVKEVGRLLKSYAADTDLGKSYVYDPDAGDDRCTIHTAEPTEPETQPTEPTEPTAQPTSGPQAALPPEEFDPFGRHRPGTI